MQSREGSRRAGPCLWQFEPANVWGPAAGIAKPFASALFKAAYPLAYRLAVNPEGLRHSRHRRPIDYRLHHAHSTLRREWGILVCVHLGPPVGNTDDVALISFP